jgi:hypothetical protein
MELISFLVVLAAITRSAQIPFSCATSRQNIYDPSFPKKAQQTGKFTWAIYYIFKVQL